MLPRHAARRFLLATTTCVAVAACSEPPVTGSAPLVTVSAADTPDRRPANPDPADTWRVQRDMDVETLLDCLEAADASIVSAHRGGPATGAPENSIVAFANTLRATPALIEFDVATSADGVMFLMHDDELDRTTTGAGLAAEKSWPDIAALRLVDPEGRTTDETPPTFDEALTFVTDRTFAQIDFKRSTRFEDVIDAVRRHGVEHRVVLIAYTTAQARRLHQLAPDMKISASIETPERFDETLRAGIPAESLVAFTGVRTVDGAMNAALDDADVEVIFGTLGGGRSIDTEIAATRDDGRYAEISRQGVDVIATDRPIPAGRSLASAGRGPRAGACGVLSPSDPVR